MPIISPFSVGNKEEKSRWENALFKAVQWGKDTHSTAHQEGIPPTHWAVGETINVDTEDGLETGAVILGVSEAGTANEMRIQFADGTVDDWPVTDFIKR